MLGISVYLGHKEIEEQEKYIIKMNKYGFQTIFTSLHIPEDNPTIYKEQLLKLGQLAKSLHMELIADISPKSLKELGLNWNNAKELIRWGVTGIRADYGIDEAIITTLSKEMKIALNASTLMEESLERMKRKGINLNAIEAWHNFYPRPDTGLGWNFFKHKNDWLVNEGIKVTAFAPGDGQLRGPLYEKLPTVEKHRNFSPFASYLDLKLKGKTDRILIGDITIKEDSLEQFKSFEQDVILLRCKKSQDVDDRFLRNLSSFHTNRADLARDVIRSVESRNYASIGNQLIEPHNCKERPIGTITIDNKKYLRYQGEIQISKRNLPADPRVNVLGHVIDKDLPLLKHIRGNQKFSLMWI